MGNCLQAIFSTHRSALRKDPLLNHQQLTTIIKPSTQNDQLFYACPNLSSVQKFLTEFSLKPNMPINQIQIKDNISILVKFLSDLKDRTSQVGKQIAVDQNRVKSYVEGCLVKGLKAQSVKESAIILRLQIQALLLGASLLEDLACESDWDLIIEIYEQKSRGKHSKENPIPEWEANQSNNNDLILLQTIKVKKQLNSAPNNEQTRARTRTSTISLAVKNKIINAGSMQECKIFCFLSQIVNKNSLLRINLCKIKRKKYIQLAKAPKNGSESIQKPSRSSHIRHKAIIGHTCLSVSDFIYYNSLIVSDVVSLSPQTSIKSSITTSTSSSTASAIAFISLRGQGLRAQTLEKDFVKIVKQHEVVIQQLQLCLEGEKGWEKLSEFRNSNQSNKNQSLYSDYSVPQEIGKMYKL